MYLQMLNHSTAHQIALASGGLMDYVMNAPRDDLVSANKEGLISLAGLSYL